MPDKVFWQARIVSIASQDNSNSSRVEVTVEFKDNLAHVFTEVFTLNARGRHGIVEEFKDLVEKLKDRLKDMDSLKLDIDELGQFIDSIITQMGLVKPADKATHFGFEFARPILK